jgi:hypothetical protein
MSSHHETSFQRLHELLADRATQALLPVESGELADLLGRHPDVDATTYDRVAAALDIPSFERHFESMPAAVREKAEAGAIAWLVK